VGSDYTDTLVFDTNRCLHQSIGGRNKIIEVEAVGREKWYVGKLGVI
jgi:hypothetical protein